MRSRTFLLTGATGILGTFVLDEAIERGYLPIALMRDADRDMARQRLAKVFEFIGRPGEEGRVRILKGDATLPNLGMNPDELDELRGSVGGVIHCAASTSFSDDQKDDIVRTNVGGVENMLDVFQDTPIPFYHVSTAYVAGKRDGIVYEGELEHDAGFQNVYEQTKNQSEQMVRNAFAEGRLRGAVFRPAIIVGASADGRIAQFWNFYSFIQVLDFAMMRPRRNTSTFHLNANPECTKNLTPVDWTAQAMWRIIEKEGPSGETYHLTNPSPPTHRELVKWGNRLLADIDMRIEFGDEEDGGATFQRQMRGKFESFEGYLNHEPVYDRANTERALEGRLPFPTLDHGYLDRMFYYARENRWRSIFGKRAKTDMSYMKNIVPVEKERAAAS